MKLSRHATLLACVLFTALFSSAQTVPAHRAHHALIPVMLLDGASGGPYHNWQLTTPVLQQALEETGLYQVPVTRSYGWEPYEFAPSDDRAGLLGQAGFLAIYSQSGRSSPTLRGRAIRAGAGIQ